MIGLEEALSIHEKVVAATGGSQGVRDIGGLEAALARPYASFGGEDLYPSPVEKAAAILESVVKYHPFVDGNKRAGFTLMRLTLRTFDLDIKATDDDEYDIVIQVATGKLDAEGIRAWLESRVVPMKHK